MTALLLLAWLVPVAAVALAPFSRFWWIAPVAALPALAAAALVPAAEQLRIPWLLLGSVLGLDETSRIFLAFTSVLWFAAGLYSAGSMRTGPNAGRFRTFFLLAMAGNFWLILGQDLATFYAGFSLMGIASYGLVVHEGDREALRAGKVYLVMTLVGELAVFVGLVLIAGHIGGLVPDRDQLSGLGNTAVGLLIVGFAVKAGLVPLHVWLPLAHPAAPVPASAVLSGAMIKVALLGWLRFLPIGDEALGGWGVLLIFSGLTTLFFAVPVGLVQSNPKVILAYSSVSKMGLMALTLGLILLEPDLAPAGAVALSLYAAHHALAKGGLFLGVGLRLHAGAQLAVLVGVALLALALAGVPYTGGAVAKYGIKPVLASTDWAWFETAVALGVTATALLVTRFLWVVWHASPQPEPGYALGTSALGGLVALSLSYALILGKPDAWVTDVLPLALAGLLVLPFLLVAGRRSQLLRPAVGLVRPGDLLTLIQPYLATLELVLEAFGRWGIDRLVAATKGFDAAVEAVTSVPADPERGLRKWSNAGASWLLILALLFVLPLGSLPVFVAEDETTVAAVTPPAPSADEPAGEPAVPAPDAREEEADGEPPPLDRDPDATGEEEVAALPADAEETGASPLAPDAVDSEEDIGPAGPEEVVEAEDLAADTDVEASAPPPGLRQTAPDEEQAPPEIVDTQDYPPCDPKEAFVFGHPDVTDPLRLNACVEGPEGPRLRTAPTLTNPLVDRVQRHLRDLGYSPGPVDGLIGPRTRAAIRRFQQAQGREPTGEVTFALLELIRSEAQSAPAAEDEPANGQP